MNIFEITKDYAPFKNYEVMLALIREIDRDNSTNVWRYGNKSKIEAVLDYIFKSSSFYGDLKSGRKKLPDILNESAGGGILSLSSKICKYLSEYEFCADNFFIYDSYVRALIGFYYDEYVSKTHHFTTTKNITYEELFDLLEQILKNARIKDSNPSLKRSELDHLIWYCYKSFEL